MIGITRARLTAVTELTAGRVTDEMLVRAREAHLFHYAEYVARQPLLATAAPHGTPQLYEPAIANDALANCCG